jgi:hypothetical protein
MMSQIYRTALILHTTPKEIMQMSRDDMDGIWNEQADMSMEMTTGRKKPKLYEYEREALNRLREMM